jgi:hypothetical protein
MNVINKLFIFIVFISISSTTLFSSDIFSKIFSNDLSIGIGLKYGKDTINRHDFEWTPTIGYRLYFLPDVSEITMKDDSDEYSGVYNNEPTKKILLINAVFFLDLMTKLKIFESNEYGGFLQEDKTSFDFYFGVGYLMHIKNSYYMSFFGGGNFYKESSVKSFNEENASPDLEIDYVGNEYGFSDYGFYLGFDTIFFLSKSKLNNVFTLSIAFTYNYKIVLNEHNLLSALNLGFKF